MYYDIYALQTKAATLDTWTDTQKRQWVLNGEGEGSDREGAEYAAKGEKKKNSIHVNVSIYVN